MSGKLLKQTLRARGKNAHIEQRRMKWERVRVVNKKRRTFEEALSCTSSMEVSSCSRIPHISQFTIWYDIWIYHSLTSTLVSSHHHPRSVSFTTKPLRTLASYFTPSLFSQLFFLRIVSNEFSNSWWTTNTREKERRILLAFRLRNTNVPGKRLGSWWVSVCLRHSEW